MRLLNQVNIRRTTLEVLRGMVRGARTTGKLSVSIGGEECEVVSVGTLLRPVDGEAVPLIIVEKQE